MPSLAEEVRAAPLTPSAHPFEGTPGCPGSGRPPCPASELWGARPPLRGCSRDRTRWEGSQGARGPGRMPAAPALCRPLRGAPPAARQGWGGGGRAQVKERRLVAFPGSAALLLPWPLAPPPHNEQLVENLHFMKIGQKDKGVSLCCPVLLPWPIWEPSPPLRPIFGSREREPPSLLSLGAA